MAFGYSGSLPSCELPHGARQRQRQGLREAGRKHMLGGEQNEVKERGTQMSPAQQFPTVQSFLIMVGLTHSMYSVSM